MTFTPIHWLCKVMKVRVEEINLMDEHQVARVLYPETERRLQRVNRRNKALDSASIGVSR